MTGIDIDRILQLAPSPAYVVDLGRLRHNLAILDHVQQKSGARILMALKAFSMWSVFPLIRRTLVGVCASSPWEARLGRDEFGGEDAFLPHAIGEPAIDFGIGELPEGETLRHGALRFGGGCACFVS